MKHNKSHYRDMKRKLMRQIIGLITGALIAVFFLRVLVNGYMGNLIVELLQRTRMSYNTALEVYQTVIRNNLSIWIFVVFVIFMIIFIRIFISWFTRYFDEIVNGVERLTDDEGGEIELSPELEFMQIRLNEIKHRLEEKTRAVKDAEQRKNELVMYLAHDLRTPLTSVKGYLNLLEEAPDMPLELRAKYTHIAAEKAQRLETLMNEFFEITRFNQQSMVLEKRRVDVPMLLYQMAEEFYPLTEPQRKKISVHAPQTLFVYADGEKLARVVNNILKNAVAYSYENSEISVTAQEIQNQLVLTFFNTGDMIPPHKLETIFEKFYRLDDARTASTGGSGLGLAIAKEMVTAHKGTITAASDENGTTFTVKIPMK